VNLAPKPFMSKKLAYPSRMRTAAQTVPCADSAGLAQSMFAHSFEFVAKPREAQRLQTIIPSALTRILKDVTGYAGCLVLVGSLEARLVNVVTLWQGPDANKRCEENVRWIHSILGPYLDHRLRLQTFLAFVPEILAHRPATNSTAKCLIEEPVRPQGEEACLV
jgi:hypothetical protein